MKYVEVCKSLYDRNKIIPKPNQPDLYYYKYRGALFYSVFDHTEEYLKFVEKTGSVSTYDGAVSCDYLPFDLDGETAQDDAWKLVLWFLDPPGHYSDTLKIYFSGNKGFHIFLPNNMFSCPSKEIPSIMKLSAESIAQKLQLKSFCPSIYHRTGIIRAPNSKHEKSGLYKIPLEVCELPAKIEEIREWAKDKRHIDSVGIEWIQ